VLVAAAVAALAAVPSVPAGAGATTTLTVDLDAVVGSLNRELVGFGWHPGGPPLDAVAPLHPHVVRIDASLQDVSTGPDEPLVLEPLLEGVAAVRAIGAEPLVILSYLPAWLGEPVAFGRDPTRVRPADLDAWEDVVHDVVLALATAPAPAHRFEAWNEPDVPLFWQDTPAAWVDTVERSARAVAAVERETGVDLAFGGPATAFPDPAYLVPFLARFRDPALPLDFVSWHYYGNYPFLGPDGAEFAVTEPVHPVVGRRNPVASPASYPPQVAFVRELTATALAGSGRPAPELVLDEWNLSAGGLDVRHDGVEGAAFAAGVLVELQAAGLDAAAFYRAADTTGVPGGHGAVAVDGTRKPVWWTFDLWQQLRPVRVAVDGADRANRLWAVATTDGRTVAVLVAAFEGVERRVRVDFGAPVRRATARRADGSRPAALDADGTVVELDLAPSDVVLVELLTRPHTMR
jgi:hypothetical protein